MEGNINSAANLVRERGEKEDRAPTPQLKGKRQRRQCASSAKRYVARIESLWSEIKGSKEGEEVMVSVRWFYRPQDLAALNIKARGKFADNEVFYSEHIDINTVRSILHHVRVNFGASGVEYLPPATSSSIPYPQMSTYICNKRYLGGGGGGSGGRSKSKRILASLTNDEIATLKPPLPPPTPSSPMQKIGALVKVASRTGAGENKQGGIGRVERICEKSRKYAVRYVLGGVETNILEKFVKPHTFTESIKKHPTILSSDSTTNKQTAGSSARTNKEKSNTGGSRRGRKESFDKAKKKRRRGNSFDQNKGATNVEESGVSKKRHRKSSGTRYTLDLPKIETRSTRVGRAYQAQLLPKCQPRPPPLSSYDLADRERELRRREDELVEFMEVQWKPPEVEGQFSEADFERLRDGIKEIRHQTLTQGTWVGLPLAQMGIADHSCSEATSTQQNERDAAPAAGDRRKGVSYACVVSADQFGSVQLRSFGAPSQEYNIVGPGLAYSRSHIITFESIEGVLREALKCNYNVDRVLQRAAQLSRCESFASSMVVEKESAAANNAGGNLCSDSSSTALDGNTSSQPGSCSTTAIFMSDFERSLCWSDTERREFLSGLVKHRILSHGLYDAAEESDFEVIARRLKTKTRSEVVSHFYATRMVHGLGSTAKEKLCSACFRSSASPHLVCSNVALGLCSTIICAPCEKRNNRRISATRASGTASFRAKSINQNWVCSSCARRARAKRPETISKTETSTSPISRRQRPKRLASNGASVAAAVAAAESGFMLDGDKVKRVVMKSNQARAREPSSKDSAAPVDYDSVMKKANQFLQQLWADNKDESPEIYHALLDALLKFRQGRMTPDELVVFGSTLLEYDRQLLAAFSEFVPKSLAQLSQ